MRSLRRLEVVCSFFYIFRSIRYPSLCINHAEARAGPLLLLECVYSVFHGDFRHEV